MKRKTFLWLIIPLLILASLTMQAQTQAVDLDKALQIALRENKELKAGKLQTDAAGMQIKTAFDIPATQIYYGTDENNTDATGTALKIIGVQQDLDFPSVYFSQKKLYRKQYEARQLDYELARKALKGEVSLLFQEILYLKQKQNLYEKLAGLYREFAQGAELKLKLGESNELEKYTADAKYQNLQTELYQLEKEKESLLKAFNLLLGKTEIHYGVAGDKLKKLAFEASQFDASTQLQRLEKQNEIATSAYRLERNKLLPGLSFELFQGKPDFSSSESYLGFQAGINIPLFGGARRAKIKQAKLQAEYVKQHTDYQKNQLESERVKLLNEILKYQARIDNYEKTGKNLSLKLYEMADKSFAAGEIDFYQYLQSLETATEIELKYLNDLREFNRKVLEYRFLKLDF